MEKKSSDLQLGDKRPSIKHAGNVLKEDSDLSSVSVRGWGWLCIGGGAHCGFDLFLLGNIHPNRKHAGNVLMQDFISDRSFQYVTNGSSDGEMNV